MSVDNTASTSRTAPHRLFRPQADTHALPSIPNLLATGAWFGLATGLLELLILFVRQSIEVSSTLGGLQMNRNFLWMIPVTHLLVFSLCALPFSLLALFRPSIARRAGLLLFAGLTAFSLLLLVKGLHTAASIILAVGIASKLAPWMARKPASLRKAVRIGLPAAIGVVAILGGLSYERLVLAERRAMANLPKAAPGAPNVLLLVLDTVRADHLSLAGYRRNTTPNIDKLAKRGVVFREARSAAPWTFPAHASLFTGRWPHELNIPVDRPLDSTFPTLAEYLAKHGYATGGFVGNTYFCNSWFGLGRGFAHYEDYYEDNIVVSPQEALRCSALGRKLIAWTGDSYNARPGTVNSLKDAPRVNEDFLSWISEHPDKPFFAFLNYIDAHDPYQTHSSHDRHFGLKPESPADVALIQSWHVYNKKSVTERDITLLHDAYDDCLSDLDDHLGRLFDDLERRGILKNTLVVITSDHGETFGEHGLYLHGQSLYRPEVHVPLILVGPGGIPAGTTVPAPVSLRDVAATIADRLALPGSPFPGRSLARFWETPPGGPTPEAPILSEAEVVSKVSRNPARPPALRGPMASLILDGKVYIRDAVGREELYDLASDPDEKADLALDPASRPTLERMRAALDREQAAR